MFDQAQRSLWLEDQLWPKLREMFSDLRRLPEQALITVGYPASGARGRSEKIKPSEVNYQWQGNENEKVFISIHPIYFTTPLEAAKALVFGCSKVVGGNRWGPHGVGLHKERDGSITTTPEAQTRLDAVLADVGEPPAGFGVPFPVRSVQRTRLRKYVATGDCIAGVHPIIRAASDTLDVACQVCGAKYKLACNAAGTLQAVPR